MSSNQSDLILYHYNASPYGQRIVYYLNLRGIKYAECMQPMTIPRADLAENLNVSYRRIPLLAAGSSIYADTRLILPTLDLLHPSETTPQSILQPLPRTAEAKAITKFLATSVISGEIFARAAQLIPLKSPVWANKAFLKDRSSLTGREWSEESAARTRPEALVVIGNFFAELENGLLADGRTWLLNTDGPTIADIEAVWIPIWVLGMKDASSEAVIGSKVFPKVNAYVQRFLKTVNDAKQKNGKAERIDGKVAAERVLKAKKLDIANGSVDSADPLALKSGQQVSVWPTDSGFSHKDQGKLVKLTSTEVAIEKDVDNTIGKGTVTLHFPRTGFRIVSAGSGTAKL